jgi:aryl-alcohol dehydrogenase-like predicted oxidoreductase
MADFSTIARIEDSSSQQQRWQGHATPEATAEYASGSVHGFTHDPAHFRSFDDGLELSSLGIGTYLGKTDPETDEAVENAVIRCIGDGWNVVDSAPVYREGRGEVAVGRALRALRIMGGCRREHLFVSSKIGIAANTQVLTDFVSSYSSSRDDVTQADLYEDGLSCWHPLWLADSLNRSLEALQINTIDLLYLHNPAEILLPSISREEFWQKMRLAFEFCERARQDGKISSYGLATWDCFRVPPDHELYISLEDTVKLAEDVYSTVVPGGDSSSHCYGGLRAIMLPINTAMREAFEQKWQTVGDQKEKFTFLEAAKRLGIAVFVSGPLAQARLLQDETLQKELDACEELAGIKGAGTKLLQVSRSVPGIVSAVVGQKSPSNVDQNVVLTKVAPLSEVEFFNVIKKLPISAVET